MSEQSFSRPGAVDLSGLQGAAGAAPGASGTSAAYAVPITEQNFQEVLEGSRSAPVLLAFESPSRSPESVQLADDLQTLSNEFEGRFLLGRVDIDAVPQIAQAMQIPSVPLVVLVAQGRPMPLIQDAAPIDDLRQVVTQVLQQLTASGFTGRHQPRSGTGGVDEETGEEQLDPRYAPAQDALERGDVDAAIAEYEKLVEANPADSRGGRRSGDGAAAEADRRRRPQQRPGRPRPRTPTTSTPRPWWPTSICSAVTSRTRSTGSSSWCVVRRTRSATPHGPT